jgi:DNA-directed RNA polymerase subunit RPC12/RpoP
MDKATPKPSLNETSALKDESSVIKDCEEVLPQIERKQKYKCHDCGGKIIHQREVHGRTSPRDLQGRTLSQGSREYTALRNIRYSSVGRSEP